MADGFHEVTFPISLSLNTQGGPERRTDIVSLSNGRESRNARWRDSRRHYDAGSGMRNVDDLYKLIAFFEARNGSLYGFRFQDPIDFSSAAYGADITPLDQQIGTGDGSTTDFQLIKTYSDAGGASVRLIEKPIAGTVRIAVDGAEMPAQNITIDATTGRVRFNNAPSNGAAITAGYQFDVPVRFDIMRLDVSLAAFNAGHIPSVPLVEIRP